MRRVLFLLAITFVFGVMAPRAARGARPEISNADYDLLGGGGGGGGNCAPNDGCCQCKAPCIKQNTEDRKTCGKLPAAAAVDCRYGADSKMRDCLDLCTADNRCQDA